MDHRNQIEMGGGMVLGGTGLAAWSAAAAGSSGVAGFAATGIGNLLAYSTVGGAVSSVSGIAVAVAPVVAPVAIAGALLS